MTSVLQLIAQEIRAAGGRLVLVGGVVRDMVRVGESMAGFNAKDIDCEVFGLLPDSLFRVLSLFGTVNAVGASFGVYKLSVGGVDYDFSIPRRDSKRGEGHRGFDVVGDPDMSFTDAARRRDFTINAVSFDPLTREYIDPFNGRDDIKNGVLRVVDFDLFGDDSLRVLRAVQFVARFGYTVDPASFDLMRIISLKDLPAERVWVEFEKLLKAPNPARGLELALELGVVKELWPELFALVGVQQDPEWHPEGDVWVHTLHVVMAARDLCNRATGQAYEKEVTVMLASLFHDLGKATTTELLDGRWRALGHEAAGVELALSMLQRLNVQTINNYNVRAQVLALVTDHLKPFELFKDQPKNIGRAFRRLSRKVDLALLADVAEADTVGRPPRKPNLEAVDWFKATTASLDLRDGPPPAILMGRHLIDLGLKPGPDFGPVLKQVYEMQLDGVVTTVDEAIQAAAFLIDNK
jgi:tRNA nucleotidyltransferase (CCA-adding enzyme)